MTIQGGSPSGSRRTRKKKEKSAHLLLDFIAGWGYNSRVTDNGLVAQLGAHHIRIVGVGSSNLLKSTIKGLLQNTPMKKTTSTIPKGLG